MFTAGYIGGVLHEERAKGKAAATLRNRERALASQAIEEMRESQQQAA